MKPILKLLTLFAVMFISTPNTFGQTPGCPEWDDSCDPGNPGEGSGAQKVPLDDYAGVLLAAGILAAGIIYYNKEKQIIKK